VHLLLHPHNVMMLGGIVHVRRYTCATFCSTCSLLFFQFRGVWWKVSWHALCMVADSAMSMSRLHNEELHNLYPSPNIIKVIKSRGMVWVGHVACIES
jgi:hypothetical protein